MSFDFAGANERQRDAIKSIDGPLLITAGPGTGKTFTLVMRVLYLILEKGVKPEEIMLATFTEKAAKELITRVSNELLMRNADVDIDEMYIGTFHSICLRIIQENNEFSDVRKNFRIADTFDQCYLTYLNINKFRKLPDFNSFPRQQGAWQQASEICRLANSLSEELIDLDKMLQDDSAEVRSVAQVTKEYGKVLEESGMLDFTSLQVQAYKLLVNNPEVLTSIQNKIKYLMIDEYQDTNYIQERLALLFGKSGNVCVVGDDDQGLYRFRGATIRNILEFPSVFGKEGCHIVSLDENYRSEPRIIDFYNNWMMTTSDKKFKFEWGDFRYEKKIRPYRERLPLNDAVAKITVTPGMGDWEEKIYRLISNLKESGKITDYNQVVLLTKSVKHNRIVSLSNYLEGKGIAVYSPRSGTFFLRNEIRMALGCLMLLFPRFVADLESGNLKFVNEDFVNYCVDCILHANSYIASNDSTELKTWIGRKGYSHMRLTKATDYAFSDLFYELLQFSPFKEILDIEVDSGVSHLRALRNLSTLLNIINKYEYLYHFTILTPKMIHKRAETLFKIYIYYLWQGGLAEYEDEEEYLPSGCVPFLTIHQSKGMEFPIVLVDTTNATPKKSNDELVLRINIKYGHRPEFEPLDRIKYFDFWRLYYTAFSRAKDYLILTSASDKETQGKCFDGIYEELPECSLENLIRDDYDFSLVKKSSLKPTFSFTSHVALYESCPRQYKFYRELEFPQVRAGATLFGELVHQTIEDVHRAILRGESETVTSENVEQWFAANYESLTKSEHSYLAIPALESALRQVLRYVEKQSDNWDRIRDCEVKISFAKPEYIIEGFVDLIAGEGDTVELVDFKAERKPDIYGDKDRIERYRRQLLLYAYLVEEKTGHSVSKMHLYYTGEEAGVPTLSFSRDPHSIDRAVEEFDLTVRRIMRKDFEHESTKLKQCENCDFRFYCGK